MLKDYSLLPFFIHEELFLLPEDRQANPKPAQSSRESASTPALQAVEVKKESKKIPPLPTQPGENKEVPQNPPAPASPAAKEKKHVNPNLIFGKNAKQLLVLVEDHHNPVMERADGLFLKDVLKAIGYTFDDVAIVNICHCREEADWEAVKEIPFTTLFSFGITHPQLPFTKALAPYELEKSGERKFLLADTLPVLRANRARKITLWNLLKQLFV